MLVIWVHVPHMTKIGRGRILTCGEALEGVCHEKAVLT